MTDEQLTAKIRGPCEQMADALVGKTRDAIALALMYVTLQAYSAALQESAAIIERGMQGAAVLQRAIQKAGEGTNQ